MQSPNQLLLGPMLSRILRSNVLYSREKQLKLGQVEGKGRLAYCLGLVVAQVFKSIYPCTKVLSSVPHSPIIAKLAYLQQKQNTLCKSFVYTSHLLLCLHNFQLLVITLHVVSCGKQALVGGLLAAAIFLLQSNFVFPAVNYHANGFACQLLYFLFCFYIGISIYIE